MTIPLRLGILNNRDDAGNDDTLPACGFGEGGKWNPLVPGNKVNTGVETDYVGYWQLNELEGSEAIDISENELPMQYVGSLDLGTLNAPHFDGLTTYLRGEKTAMYDASTEISVVVYYKVDEPIPYNPDAALVSKWATGAESWGVFLDGDGTLRFKINADQEAYSLDTFFEEDVTYKVVFTYDGTNVRLYVNDSEQSLASSMTGAINKTTTNINIGRTEDGNKFFHGWIRDVVVYRYALTIEEIVALPVINIGEILPTLSPEAKAYRDAVSALTPNKTHFGLDDGRVGSSDIGVTSSITWTGISSFTPTAVAAQAPLLNSSYGYIANNSFITSFYKSSYTINMWCKMSAWPSDSDGKSTLLVGQNNSNNPGYLITIFAPGVWGTSAKLKFAIRLASNEQIDVYALLNSATAIDKWFMLSCVVNDTAGTVDIYINGALSTLTTKTYTPGDLETETYTREPILGTRNPSNPTVPEFYSGYMEEVSIIAGAVSATNLLNLYNTGNHYG